MTTQENINGADYFAREAQQGYDDLIEELNKGVLSVSRMNIEHALNKIALVKECIDHIEELREKLGVGNE